MCLCFRGGSFILSASAQTTAFTYQCRLTDGGSPASGIYDLRFTVYDALTGGAQQGVTLTNAATAVSNGLFTVTLDFTNQFPGAARWLEMGVRTNQWRRRVRRAHAARAAHAHAHALCHHRRECGHGGGGLPATSRLGSSPASFPWRNCPPAWWPMARAASIYPAIIPAASPAMARA